MQKGHDMTDSTVFAGLPARDEAAALAAVGGNAELANELLDTLLRGLASETATLAVRLQAGDWGDLAQTAHRLRGATAYCGVPALDTALRELEGATKSGNAERIGAGVRQVEQQAERLRATVGIRSLT